eukprot:TRINITY_DN3655_c0_g1_i1.p2 TRINITY_DN3655_c0_g1~~TRINITY_DN3655_c0_g1_i1.p2  ORF type:complete len:150 (+),score=30.65 TRINITY_DN3655_c0_g1_i1:872-1321(+)
MNQMERRIDKNRDLFSVHSGPVPTFHNIPKDVQDTLIKISHDPDIMKDSRPGFLPQQLQKFQPDPDTDSNRDLEIKMLAVSQFDERYNWHYKRVDLLQKKASLDAEFKIPLPDDLQGGYRFNVTERELNDYEVAPKLREISFHQIWYGS